MSSTSRPRRLGPLLRTPGVAAFLGGRFAAAVGTWSERIAIGWLVWEATRSPGLVGLAAFLRLAPAIALSPLGGVLADRRGAVGILRVTHAVNAAVALLLAVAAGWLPLWAVLACTAVLGVVQALAAAPIKSVVPQVLPREHLPTALPLSSATFNLAAFAGPAVAGGTIALAGVSAAFLLSVVGCLAFVLALGRWAPTDAAHRGPATGVFRETAAAFAYVRDDADVRALFLLQVAAAVCLRPFIDLLPAYIGASGEAGAAMLGIATSAIGAGAVLGALWMATSSGAASLTRRLLAGTAVAVICLGWLAFAGFSGWVLPVVLMFGTAMVVRATATLTLTQLLAPPGMRGRVAGLYSMTIRGGAAAGAAVIGAVGEIAGLDLGMAGVAAACALCLVLLWRRIGGIRVVAGPPAPGPA
jgi:predicted MFS family arabinose efflux permease